MSKNPDRPRFTPKQLAKAQEAFPEKVFNSNSTEAEMRHYAGARQVIKWMEKYTEHGVVE